MLFVLATRRQIADAHFAAQTSVGSVFGDSWLSSLSVLATRQHHAEAHFDAQASVESVFLCFMAFHVVCACYT